MRTTLLLALAILVPLQAADPTTPVLWNATHLSEVDKKLPPKINPELHLATERLLDSAFILHRDGNSTAEIHDTLADFIFVRSGQGALLIGTAGGKLVEGKRTGPGEQRGVSFDNGIKYPLAPGDMIYVPANTPHQFLVEKGKHLTATIVKITPNQ